MHYPLRTAFATSHRFWYVVFLFSIISRYFSYSPLLVVQGSVDSFLCVHEFSSFPLTIDFYFHDSVVKRYLFSMILIFLKLVRLAY